jgi:hypothetical protein
MLAIQTASAQWYAANAVERTSGTVLTIGSACTPTTPCSVRFGIQTVSFTQSATVTLSGSGKGTVYIYVSYNGSTAMLNVGYAGVAISCSAACTAVSGVTSYPVNTIPLGKWTALAVGGTWDATGGADARAFLSQKILAAGNGIAIAEDPGQTTISASGPSFLGAALLAARLPVCNSGAAGLLMAVSDAAATPAWHGVVTGTGTPAGYTPVFCNGSAWLYL